MDSITPLKTYYNIVKIKQSIMSNQQLVTMTRAEKNSLITKSKQGWKFYYTVLDEYSNLAEYAHSLRQSQLANRMRDANYVATQDDMTHLRTQFVEMYDKIQELTQCPVCFDTLTKENIKVKICGHFICKECYDIIMEGNSCECPICRAKWTQWN
jgi:hypothetical protein